PRAERQVGRPLLAQRVDRAVAVGVVAGVEEQRVDRLVAVEVDDPQDLPGRQLEGRPEAGGQLPVDPHRSSASLARKPRSFSGQAIRTGSSAGAGGTRSIRRPTAPGAHSARGSSGCGALESTTSVSSSKRTVTRLPAGEWPLTKLSSP